MKSRVASLLSAAALCAVALSLSSHASGGKYGLGVAIHGVKPKFALSEDVKLRARVNWRGPKASFTYHWTTPTGPSLPFDMSATSDELVLDKDELVAGARYHIQLRVEATYADPDAEEDRVAEATSDVEFVVNSPPHGGDCDMRVEWRGRHAAAVVVSAPNWKDDDDKQIQYRYFLLRNGRAMRIHNWSQRTRVATNTVAREGDELQARCEIRDPLGDGLKKLSDKVSR